MLQPDGASKRPTSSASTSAPSAAGDVEAAVATF